MKKDIVVVASIGNTGANGVYAAGAPGVGTKVIGVASFDNSHVSLNTFTITPDGTADRVRNAAAAPLAPPRAACPWRGRARPSFRPRRLLSLFRPEASPERRR